MGFLSFLQLVWGYVLARCEYSGQIAPSVPQIFSELHYLTILKFLLPFSSGVRSTDMAHDDRLCHSSNEAFRGKNIPVA